MIGDTMTDEQMRVWARDLLTLAARAEQDARMLERRAERVLDALAARTGATS